jgi:isoleucyl-tRNA synthetase
MIFVNDLSALYLDMSKDRLYCDGKDSIERRSVQFAMNEILKALVTLMAPILSFTAEDILKYVPSSQSLVPGSQSPVPSVFLLEMPKADQRYLDEKLQEKWETILGYREKVYQKLELLRAVKEIGGSIDARVEILAKGKDLEMLKSIESLLPMVLIVSKVILKDGEGEPLVSHAIGKKCERCWMWKETVGLSSEHSTLCSRCAAVVKSLQ